MEKFLALIVFCTAMVFGGDVALAGTCTKQDYEEMRAAGYSPEQIRAICFPEGQGQQPPSPGRGQIPAPSPQVQQPPFRSPSPMQQPLGQNCQTQFGVCSLAHLPPAPIGTPCYCVNRYTGMSDPGFIAY